MYTQCWEIIKDDTKKTFEVIGQETNNNHFTNSIHAMQKAGMTVTGITPPVSNKMSSKDVIKITGYTKEVGLHKRLIKQYREISTGPIDDW